MKNLITTLIIVSTFACLSRSSAQQLLTQQAAVQHNFTPALLDLDKILAQSPDNELALSHRANIHNRMGNFQLAVCDVKAILAINPKNKEALVIGGLALTALKAYPEAIAYLNTALTLDPMQTQIFFFRGRTHLNAGNNELALKDLDYFIQAQPGHLEAHYLRSILLTIFKRYDLALVDLKQITASASANAQLLKSAATATEKVTALQVQNQKDKLALKEVGTFYTIYKDLEQLEKEAERYIQAIDPLAKADQYLVKANAIEKAVPYVQKIVKYMESHHSEVANFNTEEGKKAKARWNIANQRWSYYKENLTPYDIANYRYSGQIYQNIKAYPPPSGYIAARTKNNKSAFEAYQKQDLMQLTQNLELIKEAIDTLSKLSPQRYMQSQENYQKTYDINLKMIETVKNAKF